MPAARVDGKQKPMAATGLSPRCPACAWRSSALRPPHPDPSVAAHCLAPSCPPATAAGRRSPAAPRATASATRSETEQEAYQRRVKESKTVEERVTSVYSSEDLHRELKQAGSQLVVLEVESSTQCDTGLDEEAELHWKADKEAALAPCSGLKHVLQRTARECPDVRFLTLEADTVEGQAACDDLGVDVLPTLQFYKDGHKLWEHRGHLHLQQDLGEGVLYYGGSAAGGVKSSEFIQEINSREQLQSFVNAQDDKVLTVVDVSLSDASACVHLFPAVLALAKSFRGFAAFARLLGDSNAETREMLQELDIKAVPTMLFYRGGKMVGRHVGSSRGDLMGQILQQQAAAGVKPPPPPPRRPSVPRRSVAP